MADYLKAPEGEEEKAIAAVAGSIRFFILQSVKNK